MTYIVGDDFGSKQYTEFLHKPGEISPETRQTACLSSLHTQQYVSYRNGYSAHHPSIRMFWKVFYELPTEAKKRFLGNHLLMALTIKHIHNVSHQASVMFCYVLEYITMATKCLHASS